MNQEFHILEILGTEYPWSGEIDVKKNIPVNKHGCNLSFYFPLYLHLTNNFQPSRLSKETSLFYTPTVIFDRLAISALNIRGWTSRRILHLYRAEVVAFMETSLGFACILCALLLCISSTSTSIFQTLYLTSMNKCEQAIIHTIGNLIFSSISPSSFQI